MSSTAEEVSDICQNEAYKYLFEDARVASYKEWPFPDDSACCVQKMAEAGFYKSGTENDTDSASCFFCQKELDGWEVDDDPWEQHSKHSPNCMFVKFGKPELKLTKGQFIELTVQLAHCRIKELFEKKKKKEEQQFKEDIKEVMKHVTTANNRRQKKK